MKRAIKIVLTGLIILIGYSHGFSQNQTDSSKIILRISVNESSIKLRWAANNPIFWKSCLKDGFLIERYTISRNGHILEEREKRVLSEHTKPAPLSEWEKLASKNKYANEYINEYAAVIAQAIYGDSFEVTGMQTNDLQGIISQSQDLEQRYSFALYCADMSFDAAVLAGWGFTDHEINPEECYLYRVIPRNFMNVNDTTAHIQYGFDHVCADKISKLPAPIQVYGEFGDRSVMLYWNNEIMKHYFSAYQIERSSDNQNFNPLGKPYAATGSEYGGQAMYLDSLPENAVNYYYRIRGISPFGETGPPSDTIQGIGLSTLKYIPQITSAKIDDNGIANIEWVFDEKGNDEIESFTLMQSSHSTGEYFPLINDIPKNIRHIHFEELLPVNYLIIAANPAKGKSTQSHPYMLIAPDSIPPASPTGLTSEIDTTGIVQIRWVPNVESDLRGYRIYKHNLRDDDPIVICDSLLLQPTYTDTVDLNNLNQYVYYTVKALDKRYNQSQFAQTLKVEKPLKAQPSSPVFTSFRVEKEGINLEWINSPDEICIRHILYRKQSDSLTYKAIQVFEDQYINSYKDTAVYNGISYTYFLTAQSKWEVESQPSPLLQVVSSLSDHPKLISQFYHKSIPEDQQIRLFWEANDPKTIRIYRIYRSENQAPISLWQETEKLSTTDNRPKTGYTYRYFIQAICFDGRISDKKEIILKY